MKKNVWNEYTEAQLKEVFELSEHYKNYISAAKTEREFASMAIEEAQKNGFVDLKMLMKEKGTLHKGDKVYANNMGKMIALFVIGEQPIEKGMNILGAHIDSPRLDLKSNPLYESSEFALLDTHYYGGIKKYQWVTLPLALHGVIFKKDGTKIEMVIGENEEDPVVGISDLLPHLATDQLAKNANKVIEGEALDVTIGNIPLKDTEKDAVKANILKLMKEKYQIEEDDFLSAEIEVVPAGRARDFGLDRSMVMAYGQDDRVCAYTSMRAIFDAPAKEKTSVCLLVDKEEIGSYGATGMRSRFFEDTIAEIAALQGNESHLAVRRALTNSRMLSSDVSAAFDPLYDSVMERKNSCYFGHGLVFNKYTGARGKSGSSDANPEYIADLRKIMDDASVAFQFAELGKVDAGGGGTIAYILAEYNMEVIDCGVAVLNMHAPWEVTSKSDIYEVYRGYLAFLQNV